MLHTDPSRSSNTFRMSGPSSFLAT
jgi:hypothetical protein